MTGSATDGGGPAAPNRCPLCGADNRCGVVAGAAACWCAAVSVDAALKQWLVALSIDDRCLCPQCASGSIPSPCVSICELDASGERCQGCGRTLDEIGGWAHFSAVEKARVWRRLQGADGP